MIGRLEIILIVAFVVAMAVLIIVATYQKKKKDKKKAAAPEKKIEPAIKKEGKQEEKAEEVKKPEVKPDESFRVIRKQSKVKINKKALKADSRNPSITRVFVGGKRVDQEPENPEIIDEPQLVKEPPKPGAMSGTALKAVGRFGTREPVINDLTKAGEGMPNRSPMLTDRTNFGSHLTVSSDNNLSGVAGTGIAKAAEEISAKGSDIDAGTEQMVKDIKLKMLGERPFQDPMRFFGQPQEPEPQKPTKKTLKDIDAKTLILADAVSKRKGTDKK